MATPSCPGAISTDVGGAAICTEEWIAVEPFDIANLDPEIASTVFAAGFVLVGTAWVIGFACRALLSMIRR